MTIIDICRAKGLRAIEGFESTVGWDPRARTPAYYFEGVKQILSDVPFQVDGSGKGELICAKELY
jgi:hypothetical protein